MASSTPIDDTGAESNLSMQPWGGLTPKGTGSVRITHSAPDRHSKFDSPGHFAERVETKPQEWGLVLGHSCESGLLDADMLYACPACLKAHLVSQGIHDLHPLPEFIPIDEGDRSDVRSLEDFLGGWNAP
jgi:hypothetical protein